METIIHNLSSEDYHHGIQFKDYVSSTQLKKYCISPKAFKYCKDNPEDSQSDAYQFGELFHSAMEFFAKHGDKALDHFAEWIDSIAVFEPPVNEKTGKPYGSSTNAHKEEYEAFMYNNQGKVISDKETLTTIGNMVKSLLSEGVTSEKVRFLLNRAKEVETSYFYDTDDGIKLKVRPDMLTGKVLVDWKSTSLEDLNEDSIVKTVIKYGYHISLSMYQYVLQKITGKWYIPVLVFVQKSAPYDAVVVDMSDWCYSYDKEDDIISMGVGALEFYRLLDLHTKCMRNNDWPGVECLVPEIMKPKVPAWYDIKVTK